MVNISKILNPPTRGGDFGSFDRESRADAKSGGRAVGVRNAVVVDKREIRRGHDRAQPPVRNVKFASRIGFRRFRLFLVLLQKSVG